MTDTDKAFGQDVKKPAPDEFVRSEGQNAGLASGATGPAKTDAAFGVVAKETFR